MNNKEIIAALKKLGQETPPFSEEARRKGKEQLLARARELAAGRREKSAGSRK